VPLHRELNDNSQGRNMDTQGNKEVVVIDIRVPFWSMVTFMIKWALAAIPAIVILAVWVTPLSYLGFIARSTLQ
jgi:hypothetical protein